MYTDQNFKTKKALKEAVAAWNNRTADQWQHGEVRPVTYHQPFQGTTPVNGEFSVEGPHYPKPHTWYARVRAENGVIVKVIS